MKLSTKIFILTGIVLFIKYKPKLGPTIGDYSTSEELARIWSKKGLFAMIPGLGFANAILDSAKAIAKNNTKGAKRYGQ